MSRNPRRFMLSGVGVDSMSLSSSALHGISQLKIENVKLKMLLNQLGIFPSPMGEDRISKFVRTLEILGEGRRKVESGKWKIVLKSLLPAQFIYPLKMVLKQSSARHTQSCLSEGVNVSLFGARLASLAQDCFITTFKPLINLFTYSLINLKISTAKLHPLASSPNTFTPKGGKLC